MACGRRAKQATEDRLVNIGITTWFLRLLDPTSHTRSFWKDYWQVSKEVIKEDKNAIPDLFKAVRCKLSL